MSKNILQILRNAYEMFYYEVLWFYQDFKCENLFLKSVVSSCNNNTGPATRDHFKSS